MFDIPALILKVAADPQFDSAVVKLIMGLGNMILAIPGTKPEVKVIGHVMVAGANGMLGAAVVGTDVQKSVSAATVAAGTAAIQAAQMATQAPQGTTITP